LGAKEKIIHSFINRLFDGNTYTKQAKYIAQKYCIKNDWSSACFFYAMAMIADNATITLNGLKKDSCQGDAIISNLCQSFGIHTSFENSNCIISKTTTPQYQSSIIDLISAVVTALGVGSFPNATSLGATACHPPCSGET
jgi:3-phosphoshikimate 1-carboxyvinyltransferase